MSEITYTDEELDLIIKDLINSNYYHWAYIAYQDIVYDYTKSEEEQEKALEKLYQELLQDTIDTNELDNCTSENKKTLLKKIKEMVVEQSQYI